MMYLGVDFGEKNIGLAIASSPLAEPLETLSLNKKTVDNIRNITQRLDVEKIIIGISEGNMAEKTKAFGKKIAEEINIPIAFHDETLTSKTVAKKLKQAAASRKKRRGPDHAFAATLILQDYLDQNER